MRTGIALPFFFIFRARLLLIITVVSFSLVSVGQKKSAADVPVLQSLLRQAQSLYKASQYDSAVGKCNQLLNLAEISNSKNLQAEAYNLLAEIMMTNGKMAFVRRYDSLLIPLAVNLKDTALIISAKNREGVYFMERGKTSEAADNFLAILKMKLEAEQSNKTAEVYSNMASLYMALGKNNQAMDWFFKALRLYEKHENEKGMGETYSNIASLYYLMSRIDDAISFQKKSIYLREKQNDIEGLVIPHINIGQLYILKDSFALSLQHLKRAVEYAERINNTRLKASSYSGMSTYHIKMKEFNAALDWQNKSIALFEETDNKPMLSRLYVSAGNLANAIKDSAGAVVFYRKALDLSVQLGNRENIANAVEKMSNFYQSRNDYVNAYKYFKEYTYYRDSIAAASALASIEKIKIEYETEKKDHEIIRLNADQRIKELQIEKQNALLAGNRLEAERKQKEIELLSKARELQELAIKQQDEELEKQMLLAKNNEQALKLSQQEKELRDKQLQTQKQFRNIMIAGVVLLVLLAGVLFNRYQLKRKLQQQAALQQMRNNIARDLHDDIGASLSNINILNELARRNADTPVKSNEYLSKAGEDIQRISESLSDIVWNISPKYDDMHNLFIRMKRYAADMFDGKDIEYEIVLPEEAEKVSLPMERRRDFYLIFKEAVNNLVKYSNATSAKLVVKVEGDKMMMTVTDNGIGFNSNEQQYGNGIHNMKKRAEAWNDMLQVISQPGLGTEVKLEMSTT